MDAPRFPRRLLLGVSAAAGIVTAVVFTLLVRERIHEAWSAEEENRRQFVESLAGVAERRVVEALGRARRLEIVVPGGLGSGFTAEVEAILKDFPSLLRIVVRDGRNGVAAAVGEPPAGAGAAAAAARPGRTVVRGSGGRDRFIIASALPPDAPGAAAGILELHIGVSSSGPRFERLLDFTLFGVAVFVAILYVLAGLAVTSARRQAILAERTRERESRIRAFGTVAAGIAHDVRNPVNAASLMVQYLERLAERPDARVQPSDLARIQAELLRVRRVIDDFVNFATLREVEVEEFELGALAASVVAAHGAEIAASGAVVAESVTGDTWLAADHARIRGVVRDVFMAAVRAAGERRGGRISVTVEGERSRVRLEVTDDAREIDARRLRTLFDPGSGAADAGLALAMTLHRTVVEAHGGTFEVEAPQGRGCRVRMVLPRRVSRVVRD